MADRGQSPPQPAVDFAILWSEALESVRWLNGAHVRKLRSKAITHQEGACHESKGFRQGSRQRSRVCSAAGIRSE
jgi:hypothetical protein